MGPTSNYMHKVTNRSMNNVWVCSKFAIKTTKLIFLLSTLNRFHTTFGGLKWHLGSYLFKFFSIKLCSQYLLRCIMYIFYDTTRNQTQIVGLFFKKGVLEFLVKILDKYSYKEFLKISCKTRLLQRYFSRILITAIKIMQLT